MQAKEFIKQLVVYLGKVDIQTRSAAISYYAMLASIPLVAIVLTFAAQLLPRLDEKAGGAAGLGDMTAKELNTALARLLPVDAADVVKNEISRIQSDPPVGLLSIGLLAAIWTASNAVVAVIGAIHSIYDVKETRPFWRVRMNAILITVLLALSFVGGLVAIVSFPTVISMLNLDRIAGSLMLVGQWVALYAIIVLSFGITYRFGPVVGCRHGILSRGSLTAAGVFLVASMLFQYYVSRFASYNAVYGSIGGVIVLLVWIWLTGACLLLGAAINKLNEDADEGRMRRKPLPPVDVPSGRRAG